MPMDAFQKAMTPHADMITRKDPKLFEVAKLPGDLSIKGTFKTLSPKTQAAVWQYVQMLFLLATTAAAVPPDMLTAIEGVAASYADKIQTGEMDLGAVTGMLLNGGLDNLLNK
jgi:hypothetical protein